MIFFYVVMLVALLLISSILTLIWIVGAAIVAGMILLVF